MKKIAYFKNKKLSSLPNEKWKDIPEFEGYYQASSLGRIKSIGRQVPFGKNGSAFTVKEKILSQFRNKEMYWLVRFSKDKIGSVKLVSRMVALSFIPNPENKKTVNHKKGNKDDNRVISLEWNTDQENNIHSFRVLGRRSGTYGKTGKDCHSSKKVKCVETGRQFDSATLAAAYFGITSSCITSVCTGKQKKIRKGYTFKYV